MTTAVIRLQCKSSGPCPVVNRRALKLALWRFRSSSSWLGPRQTIQGTLSVESISDRLEVSDLDGCFLFICLRRMRADAGSPAIAGD
jgi:hypothetical protein